MSYYDTLGVGKDASDEEIKRAYRNKAHRAHPDKGGSDEKFHPIAKAYAVLSDPGRRARYDANGDDSEMNADTMRAEAIQELARLVLSAIEALDPDQQDIIAAVRQAIRQQQVQLTQLVKQAQRAINKLERALKRLRKKGQGRDLLASMLQREIEKGRQNLKTADLEAERHKLMLAILADYSYDYTQAPPTEATQLARFISFNVP